jgi:hypothetical protein
LCKLENLEPAFGRAFGQKRAISDRSEPAVQDEQIRQDLLGDRENAIHLPP